MRQFAQALGTSASRFSAYRSGQTAPSAAFLLRAERVSDGFAHAHDDGIPTPIDAVHSLRQAMERGDDDWTYALALEVRDRLHDILSHHQEAAPAWEAQPPAIDKRWRTLIAAFVSHEFEAAGLAAPRWTHGERLAVEWVLDTPRIDDAEVKRETPAWLAERNIYIATKDLVTA